MQNIAEKFNSVSKVHQRHRETNNRQTTDGIAMVIAESNVRLIKSLYSVMARNRKFDRN